MIPLAPIVAVGIRAVVTITISATLVRSVEVTDADLVPGHLTTVTWDEACGCRRVEVSAIETDDDPPREAIAWTP